MRIIFQLILPFQFFWGQYFTLLRLFVTLSRSCGKVRFSQASVILFTGRGVSGRHPPGRHPPPPRDSAADSSHHTRMHSWVGNNFCRPSRNLREGNIFSRVCHSVLGWPAGGGESNTWPWPQPRSLNIQEHTPSSLDMFKLHTVNKNAFQ